MVEIQWAEASYVALRSSGRKIGRFTRCRDDGIFKLSMKPIINLEDHAGKTVGRRTAPANSLAYGLGLQKSLHQLRGGIPVRRGVYRFHSFEEADQWMMNALTRKKGN